MGIIKEDIVENEEFSDQIYSFGTKYFYWNQFKDHPKFIRKKWDNLKIELFNHPHFEFTMKSWHWLDDKCDAQINTESVKQIQANGNKTYYGIAENEVFDRYHLYAIILYTSFTKLCSIFCGNIRSESIQKLQSVANLSKLLIETVQCFGDCIQSGSFYRGIDKEFVFKKLIAQFHVPISTSTEKIRAAQFCSGGDGLIIQLAGIEHNVGLFGFDCKSVSSFDNEEEVFFYGGDTILRLKSIIKLKHGKVNNYKSLVEAIYFISRIINGLSIDVTPKKKTKNWIK